MTKNSLRPMLIILLVMITFSGSNIRNLNFKINNIETNERDLILRLNFIESEKISRVDLTYNWANYFAGSTLLYASFFNNGSIDIKYQIYSVYGDSSNDWVSPFDTEFHISISDGEIDDWQFFVSNYGLDKADNWTNWEVIAQCLPDAEYYTKIIEVFTENEYYKSNQERGECKPEKTVTTQQARDTFSSLFSYIQILVNNYKANKETQNFLLNVITIIPVGFLAGIFLAMSIKRIKNK